MESLPKDLLLEFYPNTLEAVRKEFNLDKPARLNEAIDILDDWVKKQPHFKKKDFSRDYLERTIISCKGLLERSKIRMDKLCTFKTLMPNFYKNTDKKEFVELHKIIANTYVPKQTPDNYRVYILKVLTNYSDYSSILLTLFKYIIQLSEYSKRYEYTCGYILVLDYTDIDLMSWVTSLNIVELRQALTLLTEGYGMRLKGLHIITPSKAINAIVSIFKQVLSEKLGNRIYTHKTIETVYEHVPKNILPVDYGGEERSLKKLNDEWFQVFFSDEFQEYLKEMKEAKTIENYRLADKFTEQYIGMPGSFRSLSVD